MWRNNVEYLLEKYNLWSTYTPEVKGVMIAYASMYGNTENAANVLAVKLAEAGVKHIVMHDISRIHVSQLISDSFKYSHLVLASPTYNGGIYPVMANYLDDMKALNVQGRTVAVLGNGTWAPMSAKQIEAKISEMKNMTLLTENFALKSSLKPEQMEEMDMLVGKIAESITA